MKSLTWFTTVTALQASSAFALPQIASLSNVNDTSFEQNLDTISYYLKSDDERRFPDCSASQKADVRVAVDKAIVLAKKAAFEARDRHPALEDIFQNSSPKTVKKLATRFESIADVLPYVEFLCNPDPELCEGDHEVAFAQTKERYVGLCTGFWESPLTSCHGKTDQVRVIFHEVSHFDSPAGDTDDIGSRYEVGTLSTSDAIDDAPSNEEFAYLVAGESYC